MFSRSTVRTGARNLARSVSIGAPVGGLNDRDSLTSMPAMDAVILKNWWPEPSRLVTRKGCQEWATGFTTEPRTIAEYAAPDGRYELFAASDGGIYDITATGPVGAPVVTGQSSDEWCPVMISTPGGNFLYLFNGVDAPLLYDGSTWEPIDAASDPAITGVPTDSLIQACVYKNRLWMVERGSLNVWYLPINSIGGEAKQVSLGSIFQRGGYIVGLYTWTLDAGAGSDDHFVVLSSNGEVAVYSGTDPEDINAWHLVGVFFVGRPIGSRPVAKFGGDLMLLCEQGVVPLSQSLLTAAIDRRAALTDKIQNSINLAINAYRLNFGWELCVYPTQNALILNVPVGGGANCQYAMNLITRAWTLFSGWDARTIVNTGLGLMFADGDSVKRAWVGETDATQLIECDVLQSFQTFRTPALNKYFTMIKPYLRSNGTPSVLYGLNGDYEAASISGNLSYTAPTGMYWGSMIWGEMVWGGSIRNISNWQTVGKVYKSAALRLRMQNNGASTEWSNTDFVYQVGGIL